MATTAYAQSDVTQPGDPIIASSSNSPGSEGVANIIDGKQTKYLNFDSGKGNPSGFIVTPSIGVTVVTGITMQSANDAPDRDPKKVVIEGSNDDGITAWDKGNWEVITTLDNIPAWTARFQTQSFTFANNKPFKSYRFTVVTTQGPSTCCFQMAEVELLGTTIPQDVTQPGDPVVASSANSPGSEGVANIIDGKQTKYLNFDSGKGTPSGFIVSPSVGITRLSGISMQSANDAPDRDPKKVVIEGSNDAAVSTFGAGNWEVVTTLDNIPAWTARFQTKYFLFDTAKPYRHYRFTVVTTQGPSTCCFQMAEVELLGSALPADVTQPGDPVIASSANSPGSEGVANIIDGKQTKYLNFDSGKGTPAGFIVSPSSGRTVVNGVTIQSANDAPDRDPKKVTIEGSNDDAVSGWAGGNWEPITTLDNIPAFAARFQTQAFVFDNLKPYKHYRFTVVTTQGPSTCCFQIAEVELLGTAAPSDVTQPGDKIFASSANSPGSEGVANIIDGKQTKYLNFDSGKGTPSGFAVSPAIGATTITGISITSANDAPDRDPKKVTIEGSNDSDLTGYGAGTWTLITTLDNIPAFANRFQTQEFYFANKQSYKHYRFTVVTTQGPSTCCMQISEVEFLAVTEGAPASAAFTLQPVNTPVLSGNTATFVAGVNGPWPVQWLKNGQPIPGAVKTSYTTEAITSANANDVYACKIVGRETSTEVKAIILDPTARATSIAVSFVGGGANGAPTSMQATDIAGVELQAYWNNAEGGSGDSSQLPNASADPAVPFHDSLNKDTQVTFEWQTSGQWGSGTGDATATQRMLNGMVGQNFGQNAATYTFNNVPDGTHSVLVYTVSPPLQFQTVAFKAAGATEQTYYVRVMNSDEYNAAPGFYRGTSTDKNNPTVGDFVRFDNVKPNNGTIVISSETLTSGFDRSAGISGIQLVLNSKSPGQPPSITQDPAPTSVKDGGTAKLTVQASGDNLTYQWRKNGRNLPNGGKVSGATSATLTITGFSDTEEGVYSVAVFNPAGSQISKNAAVRLSKFDISEGLAGYWKLNETSGTTAANAASGGKAGTVTGTAAWGKGAVGNAFNFDGQTFIKVDDYTKAKKAISGSAWVNAAAGASADEVVMRNAQGALTVSGGATRIVGQFELGLVFNSDTGVLSPMAAVGIGPNVARATAASAFPTGGWHQLAFSADGAQLRVYVDGKEVAVTDYLADINPPDVPYISIGGRLNLVDPTDPTQGLGADPQTPNFLAGGLDELALWTRAISAVEVGLLYEAGKAGKEVTSVVVPVPVVESAQFTGVKVEGGNVTLTWSGSGVLQSSATVNGTYADVPKVSGQSATLPASGAAQFFRFK